MTIADSMWLTVGLVLGGVHASALQCAARRAAARRPSAQRAWEWGAASGMLRLMAVGAVLVAAALAGGVVPACLGWGVGFIAIAGLSFVRDRKS